MNTHSRGQVGEDRAADYLAANGYIILKRNFRSAYGEVDIIAVRGDELVFVEVKNWASFGLQDVAYSITDRKKRKIMHMARKFMYENQEYGNHRIRFDLLFFQSGKDEFHHIQNALITG